MERGSLGRLTWRGYMDADVSEVASSRLMGVAVVRKRREERVRREIVWLTKCIVGVEIGGGNTQR